MVEGAVDDGEALPPGSFGAGGWAPGGKGSYPRLSPADAVQARADFRKLLLKRYHSVLRAWKAIDRDGNGRLSIFEFMRACQDLGVTHGARNLWDALDIDRSGFISLEEIDEDLAKLLGSLALTIWVAHGTLDQAWEERFNRQGFSFRVPKEDFIRACEEMGYPGNAGAAFEALRADLATVGISREEFNFLDLWFAKVPTGPRSPLHKKAELEQTARHKDERDVNKQPSAKALRESNDRAKREFKALLVASYGNFLRAWREGLDRDHNGVLDYREFKKACMHVGYPGARSELWAQLDANNSGMVTLRELDEPTYTMLETIYDLARRRYGSWEVAWAEVFDVRQDDYVTIHMFIDGARSLNYKGNPEKLFDLLDLDRVKHLTLASTSWIALALAGDEKPVQRPPPEEIGDIVIPGRYKQVTRSQMRKLDDVARDSRVRQHKLVFRARGEMPGSSPHAGTFHLGAGKKLSSQDLSMSMTMLPEQMMYRTNSASFSSSGGFGNSTWPQPAFMQRASSASALSPKERPSSRDPVGEQRALPLPGYLGGPGPMPPGSGSKVALEFPLAPQSPGRGGWPAKAAKLTDPLWGGTGARARGTRKQPPARSPWQLAAELEAVPAEALLQAAVSAPSLARWRETAGTAPLALG